MSDLEKTHPYIYTEDDSTRPRGKPGIRFAHYINLIQCINIPPANVKIRRDGDTGIKLHFARAAERTMFQQALQGMEISGAYIGASDPAERIAVNFNPDDYKVIHMKKIPRGIDPSGEALHCIECCKMAGYKDFRVISRNNTVTVYIPHHADATAFTSLENWYRTEKAKQGIPVNIERPAPPPFLRVVE